jgi:hypothetical protein
MNPKYFVPPLQPAKRQRVGETPKKKTPQEEFIKRVTIGGGGLRCG